MAYKIMSRIRTSYTYLNVIEGVLIPMIENELLQFSIGQYTAESVYSRIRNGTITSVVSFSGTNSQVKNATTKAERELVKTQIEITLSNIVGLVSAPGNGVFDAFMFTQIGEVEFSDAFVNALETNGFNSGVNVTIGAIDDYYIESANGQVSSVLSARSNMANIQADTPAKLQQLSSVSTTAGSSNFRSPNISPEFNHTFWFRLQSLGTTQDQFGTVTFPEGSVAFSMYDALTNEQYYAKFTGSGGYTVNLDTTPLIGSLDLEGEMYRNIYTNEIM